MWRAGGVLCGGKEKTLSVLQIVTLVLEALLGVFVVYAAYTLFAWTPPSVTKVRDALHYPRWYWVLAGIMATIGAIGLFAGLFISVVGAAAALWVVAYFVVATLSHLVRADWIGFTYPLLFLVASVGLLALRWGDMTPLLALVGR
jgi:DoxX-like protein